MTHSQLDVMIAESRLESDAATELAAALSPLAALADQAAPAPSAELMRLFGEAPDSSLQPHPHAIPQERGEHRTRAALAGVVVLALSGVGATGLSAAANTLPRAWQHGVADFSRNYLPFDFPEPSARSQTVDRDPDAGRGVQGDPDDVVGRRGVSTQATRSATEDRAATEAGPAPDGPGPQREERRDLRPTGHAVPAGPPEATTGGTAAQSPSEGGGQDPQERPESPGPSRSPDPTEGPGRDGDGTKNGSTTDDTDQGERPVKASGPRDVQKGLQKPPQNGAQQGGVQGEPGGGAVQGPASPGAPEQSPPQQENGSQGSTGPAEGPAAKDVGAVEDPLSRPAQPLAE